MGMTRQPCEWGSPCQCRCIGYRGVALPVFFYEFVVDIVFSCLQAAHAVRGCKLPPMEVWIRMYQWLAEGSRAFSVR